MIRRLFPPSVIPSFHRPSLLKLGSLSVSASGSCGPLLSLIHAVVSAARSRHSQNSLLPLCLHTFVPAVVTKPPLAFFSPRLLTHRTFLTQAAVPGRISLLFFFLLIFYQQPFFSLSQALKRQRINTEDDIYVGKANRSYVGPLGPNFKLDEVVSVPVFTFMPAAAAGPPGSTAWMWQGLLPRTTKPQPTASPTI